MKHDTDSGTKEKAVETPQSNIPPWPPTESLSADPKKYPIEFATKRIKTNFGTEHICLNPAAKTSAIKSDPASDPSHSPAPPRNLKYAATQPTAYNRNARPYKR